MIAKTNFGKILGLALALFTLISCGSGRESADASQEYLQLVDQVKELDLEIQNTWANPLSGSRINLQGNSNYIRLDGQTAAIFLPYFGERHTGGGFGAEGGIKYEGPMENLKIEEDPRKEQVQISFSGEHKSERFDFLIMVYPNGQTRTSVGTSQRDQISYQGHLQE